MRHWSLLSLALLASCAPKPGVPLTGKVEYSGSHRESKAISMDAEADCEKLHSTPVSEERIVVDSTSGLSNAFVYIKSGLDGKTRIADQNVELAVALVQCGA